MCDKDQRGTLYIGKVDATIIFKVIGHGYFDISQDLLDLSNHYIDEGNSDFTMDFQDCGYVDSTFIGATCAIAIRLTEEHKIKLKIANMNGFVRETFDIMGLLGLFSEISFQYNGKLPNATKIKPRQRSRRERQEHVLMSHQTLVKLDEKNQVKFRNVIEVLQEELSGAPR